MRAPALLLFSLGALLQGCATESADSPRNGTSPAEVAEQRSPASDFAPPAEVEPAEDPEEDPLARAYGDIEVLSPEPEAFTSVTYTELSDPFTTFEYKNELDRQFRMVKREHTHLSDEAAYREARDRMRRDGYNLNGRFQPTRRTEVIVKPLNNFEMRFSIEEPLDARNGWHDGR